MPEKPQILEREWVSHSKLFHVERLRLRFSNGAERDFERLNPFPHRAVIVVPMLDAQTVLLVREFGSGLDSYHLSLPRGALNQDEDVLEGANRELMEEAGYGARELVHLTRLSILPNYMGTSMELVLARQLYPKKLAGDEPEPLEPQPWPLDQLQALVAREDCSDAAALAALYIVREQLEQSAVGDTETPR